MITVGLLRGATPQATKKAVRHYRENDFDADKRSAVIGATQAARAAFETHHGEERLFEPG